MIEHIAGTFVSARRAAVSVIFATAIIPLLMIVLLSVDYGLYNEAQSQLDMAADASALHAARIAAQLLQNNDTSFLTKGEYAGRQWFSGQLGAVPQAYSKGFSPQVALSYVKSTNLITAQVKYSGVIRTNFARLVPGSWPYYPNWGIAGAATAVVSVPSYVEVLMLLDNSSSMLIAAYPGGISTMDADTPCSKQAANEGQSFDYNYSWAFIPTSNGYISETPLSAYSNTPAPNAKAQTPPIMLPWGYGTFVYPSNDPKNPVTSYREVPPPAATTGQCDARFTGGAEDIPCPYPGPGFIKPVAASTAKTAGQCTNKGGGYGSIVYYPGTPQQAITPIPNMPQAPCAFACHNDPGNDYYALARREKITLRFDIVQKAADNVVAAINSPSNPPGQISVGVYDFNEAYAGGTAGTITYPALPGFTNDYPGSTEASYDLSGASAAVSGINPPLTPDQADTDFPAAMSKLASIISKTSGNGATKSNARKNLFIVTDGMQDFYAPSQGSSCPPLGTEFPNQGAYQDNGYCRYQGPVDPTTSCKPIKDLGVTIYVLYTLYQPLPNPFYLNNDINYAESPSGGEPPIQQALRECATSDNDFYEAKNSNEIEPALLKMLAAALGSSDRLSE